MIFKTRLTNVPGIFKKGVEMGLEKIIKSIFHRLKLPWFWLLSCVIVGARSQFPRSAKIACAK